MRKSVLIVTSILNFIVVCLCVPDVSASKKFLKFDHICSKRVENGYRKVEVTSKFGCCHECMLDSCCGAVSVTMATGVCWLHVVTPDECNYDNVATDHSWSVYAKDRPGTTWLAFQESCYFIFNTYMQWSTAEEYCRQHNGHLVRVDSGAENEFIKENLKLLGGRHWMGLTYNHTEEKWLWCDTKKQPTFTDWAPDEPSKYYGAVVDDCVEFLHVNQIEYQGKWNNAFCEHLKRPLCEIGYE